MGRDLRSTLERAAKSQSAEIWLGAVAFLNSFILPVPAETLLIPLCLARPERAWRYAGVATIAAVLGGLAGYAIGAVAFAKIGLPIIEFYGASDAFERATDQFNTAGAQWILLATITPLPYKLVTIASGASGMNIVLFTAASLAGRLIGYFLTAAIIRQFGGAALRAFRSPAIKLAAVFILLVGLYVLIS